MLPVYRCLVDFVCLEGGVVVLGVGRVVDGSRGNGFGNCDRGFGRGMSAARTTGASSCTGVLVLTVCSIALFSFTAPLHKFVGIIYLHVLFDVGDMWKDLEGRVI